MLYRRTWFMHDGASPYFSRVARQILNERFSNGWIVRARPIAWPIRSPNFKYAVFLSRYLSKVIPYSSVELIPVLKYFINVARISVPKYD